MSPPSFLFFPLCVSLQKLVIHLLYFILSSPPLALFFFVFYFVVGY